MASIRFDPLGFIHDPYPLPAGNPIDPQPIDEFRLENIILHYRNIN